MSCDLKKHNHPFLSYIPRFSLQYKNHKGSYVTHSLRCLKLDESSKHRYCFTKVNLLFCTTFVRIYYSDRNWIWAKITKMYWWKAYGHGGDRIYSEHFRVSTLSGIVILKLLSWKTSPQFTGPISYCRADIWYKWNFKSIIGHSKEVFYLFSVTDLFYHLYG